MKRDDWTALKIVFATAIATPIILVLAIRLVFGG